MISKYWFNGQQISHFISAFTDKCSNVSNVLMYGARFDVHTAMKIQVAIFWGVKLCSDVVRYHRFGGP